MLLKSSTYILLCTIHFTNYTVQYQLQGQAPGKLRNGCFSIRYSPTCLLSLSTISDLLQLVSVSFVLAHITFVIYSTHSGSKNSTSELAQLIRFAKGHLLKRLSCIIQLLATHFHFHLVSQRLSTYLIFIGNSRFQQP